MHVSGASAPAARGARCGASSDWRAPPLRHAHASHPRRRCSRSACKWSATLAAASTDDTLLVCIGKTCRQEGSQLTLEALREMTPPSLRVNNATCMGRCGGGPHLSLRPRCALSCWHRCLECACLVRARSHLVQGLASTRAARPPARPPARPLRSGEELEAVTGAEACAEVLRRCRPDDGALVDTRLAALRLRCDGEAAAARGEHAGAEELLTAALELRPDLHAARLARATARAALGAQDGALADVAAVVAVTDAPTKLRARAHVVAAGVHLARNDPAQALKACAAAAAVDPSIVRAKEHVAAAQAAAAQVQSQAA
jgi:hypothetical protein